MTHRGVEVEVNLPTQGDVIDGPDAGAHDRPLTNAHIVAEPEGRCNRQAYSAVRGHRRVAQAAFAMCVRGRVAFTRALADLVLSV